jgi:hypothetical protein
VGNSAPVNTNPIIVNSVPLTTSLDIDNISSGADGELTVALIDTVNSASNNVYYWYSIDQGNTFANSTIKYTGVEPNDRYYYTITGLTPNRSYTVYNMARNTVGNSAIIHTGTYYGGRGGPFPVSYRYLKFEVNARFTLNTQNYINAGRLAVFGNASNLNNALTITTNKSLNTLNSPYNAGGMAIMSGYSYNNVWKFLGIAQEISTRMGTY